MTKKIPKAVDRYVDAVREVIAIRQSIADDGKDRAKSLHFAIARKIEAERMLTGGNKGMAERMLATPKIVTDPCGNVVHPGDPDYKECQEDQVMISHHPKCARVQESSAVLLSGIPLDGGATRVLQRTHDASVPESGTAGVYGTLGRGASPPAGVSSFRFPLVLTASNLLQQELYNHGTPSEVRPSSLAQFAVPV